MQRCRGGRTESNMSNRNDYGSQNRKAPNKHIRNTDNEKTQYIPSSSDNEATAEFSTGGYGNQPYVRQNASQYGNSPNFTEGRRQYYGSEGGVNSTYSSQNRPSQQNMSQQQRRQAPANGRSDRPAQNGQQRPPQPRSSGVQQPQRRPQQNGQRPSQHGNAHPPQQRRHPQDAPNPKQNRRTAPPTPPPPQKVQRQKKRRKKSIVSRIVTWILSLVLGVFVIYSAVALFMISKLNFAESSNRSHVMGALSKSYVTNVLLIGTDGRSLDEKGRSDTMILVSINSKTDEITLTSFMRDSYVSIPGYGWNKLNAAYAFGGADLLMDTIEQNFSVRIDNYVSVNFMSFASIIDSVGGIEIDVSDAEAREINTILMAEVNEIMGDAVDSDLLSSGGKLHLSGKQALSYARIRYIGNADFERTERQREVLTLVAEKLKTSFSPSMISDVASKAVPQLTTNMSAAELYLLSLRLPFILGYDMTQLRIPADGTYTGANYDCGSVLEVDFNANYNILQSEVFGE